MRKNKALLQEKDFLLSLDDIVTSYEEIAAMKTRQIKKNVLYNRKYLAGLNEAYAYVSFSSSKYRKEVDKKTGGTDDYQPKAVRVFLSTNTGLFGDLIRDTFDLFAKDIATDTAQHIENDLIVVGKMGIGFMRTYLPSYKYTYFDLSDMSKDEVHVNTLFTHLSDYKDIIVYHGIFRNMLSQNAVRTFLLGEVDRLKAEMSSVGHSFNFIFEPSVAEVADYFENQIRLLLFEQNLNEASLSKYASRMINLSDAQDKILERENKVNMLLRKIDHKHKNLTLFSNYMRTAAWNS